MTNQQIYKYIKIFGERNTGTNFFNEVLRLNTNCVILENGSNRRANARLASIKGLDQSTRELAMERLIDMERKNDFLSDFGWKHANVNARALRVSPLFKDTFFIFLVRNPFKFIVSLFKRPYNLFPRPSGTLHEFINSPLIANARDGFIDDFIESPVELWNKKVASYHRSLDVMPSQSILIFYEELVASPEGELAKLKSLGVNIVNHPIKIHSQSTKGDSLTFEDYRMQSSNFQPLDHMTPDEALAIASRLRAELLIATPYEIQVKKLLA